MAKDWRRLADLAARRRAELRLTQADVAQRGPLSLDRVQAIEGAKKKSYRLSTLAALERALEWAPGSVDSILVGGEPLTGPVVRVHHAELAIPSPSGGPPITDEDLERMKLPELVALAEALLDQIEAKLPPRKRPPVRLSKETIKSTVSDPPSDVDHS